MKQIGAFFLVCTAWFSLLATDVNLVKNPGFEEGGIRKGDTPVHGWRARSAEGMLPCHAIVSEEPHGGVRCAKIRIPEGAGSSAACYFSPLEKLVLQGGKTYRFSFWARPLEGKGRLRLVQQFADGRHHLVRELPVNSDPNVRTWRRFSMDFVVPDSETEAKYLLFLNLIGPGEIYYDDVSVTEIVPDRYRIDFYPGSVSHQKKFPVLKGEYAPLFLYVFTDEEAAGHDLELELPEGLTLKAALPLYCGKESAPEFFCTVEAGRTVCRIPLLPAAVLPLKQYTTSKRVGSGMLFSAAETSKGGPLKWKIRKGDEVAAEGVMEVVPVEPFYGKIPARLPVYSWNLPILTNLRNRDLLTGYLSQVMKGGIRGGGLFFRKEDHELFDQAGFTNFQSQWYYKPVDHCMTRFLKGDTLTRRFNVRLETLKQYKNAMLNLDYEPSMDEYNHWCEDCRAAFEAETGKSAVDFPDAASVQKAYPAEYLKFRGGQHYRIAELFAETCHQAEVKAGFCSYARSKSPETNLRVEKMVGDQKSYYRLMDAVTAMIYFTPDRLWDQLTTNLEYWPDTTVTFTSDEYIGGNTPGYALLTPESVYLETMTAAMLRCSGVLFFVGCHTFDAAQINALRKALDEVASFEDFLYSDDQSDENAVRILGASPAVRSRLYRKGDRLLLGVINPDTERSGFIEFEAAPPFGCFALLDRKTGKYYRNREKSCVFEPGSRCMIRLDPGEVRFLELEKAVQDHRNAEGIDLYDPEDREPVVIFENELWKCTRNRGEIQISGPVQDYRILISDGAVLAGPGIFTDGNGAGGFFRDLILYPKVANWCPDARAEYKLEKVSADGQTLTLGFSHPYKLAALQGLVLEKTYRLKADPVSVEADIRLVNRSDKPMTLAYWSHNRTDLEMEEAVYSFGRDQVLKSAEEQNRQKGGQRIPVSGGPCRIAEQSVGLLECTAGEIADFYFWTGSRGPTMEFQSPRLTIPPDESLHFVFLFTPCRNSAEK